MTRRRKTPLVVFALVFLAVGASAWYWQATAVERQVDALLAEVRRYQPGVVVRWLMKLGLRKGRRIDRMYYEVVPDLAKLGPSAVPHLIRALDDEDLDVQRTAAWALGELGDDRALEPLIAALKDENGRVRSSAAFALGKLGDPRGLRALIAVLKDEEEGVRFHAALALGKLGDARAIEPLAELLGDQKLEVRVTARAAIDRLRGQSGAKSRPSRQTLE